MLEVGGVDETVVAELAREPTDSLVNTARGRRYKMSSVFYVTKRCPLAILNLLLDSEYSSCCSHFDKVSNFAQT